MLDILPSGNFKGTYPLNTVVVLPASKEKIKEAVKTYIDFYTKKDGRITSAKKDGLVKIYVSLASFLDADDFKMVMKLNLSLGKLYTDDEEEVLAWFSSPKNKREYERSNEITGSVMLEAKRMREEIEMLFRN